MWLPFTCRTFSFADGAPSRSRTRLTHGPVALTTARARTVVRAPPAPSSVSVQPSAPRCAPTSAVRTRTSAPASRAAIAMATTSRASSTRASA